MRYGSSCGDRGDIKEPMGVVSNFLSTLVAQVTQPFILYAESSGASSTLATPTSPPAALAASTRADLRHSDSLFSISSRSLALIGAPNASKWAVGCAGWVLE